MKTKQIAFNYASLDASGLAVKGQSIHDSLISNSYYPSCVPFISILQTNVTALTSTITAGGNTPTPAQTSAIHTAQKDVKNILRVIGGLVNWDGNGNETILLTSGFDLKNYSPPNPKTFKAKLGKLSGEVDLEINSNGNAAYYWEITNDPIGITTWAKASLTTTSKTTITGLTPGTKFWFRVSITKSNKVVVVSDPYTIMVV